MLLENQFVEANLPEYPHVIPHKYDLNLKISLKAYFNFLTI